MWYRVARQLVARGFGSFPKMGRPQDPNVASQAEARQMAQEAVQRRNPKPWSQMTIEERLQYTPNRNGHMDGPGSIPDALLNSQGVQPAAIADQHATTDTSGDASRGYGTFDEGFRENPDPRYRFP